MLISATDPAAGLVSLERLVRRETLRCGVRTPVREALEAMRSRSIGSIVVVDPGQRPAGILTLRDVLDRVALEPACLEAPIERVMTPAPVTQHAGDGSYQAALLMVRHGVRHIVLVHGDGTVAGVVSERDLFGMQTTGLRHLSSAIRSATDLPAVEAYGRDIGELARRLVMHGAAVGPLTAFVSSLVDLLGERIVTMELAAAEVDPATVCWIVLGSEGRSEQTLATDQDNGIVFRPAPRESVEAARARLVPIAQRINRALDRAGFRLCPGNIMAGNPECCLSIDEWRTRFAHWMGSGDPEALLRGSIFFDLRPLTGAMELARELRAWLLAQVPKNPRFLHQMALGALENRPALGFLERFATRPDGTIDLKRNGAAPFVEAARILSLGSGIDEVRTDARLARAGEARVIPANEVAAWTAAFHEVQRYRLRRQADCIEAGLAPDNRLTPGALHDFDRQILRAALEQARLLQRRLALDHRVWA